MMGTLSRHFFQFMIFRCRPFIISPPGIFTIINVLPLVYKNRIGSECIDIILYGCFHAADHRQHTDDAEYAEGDAQQ